MVDSQIGDLSKLSIYPVTILSHRQDHLLTSLKQSSRTVSVPFRPYKQKLTITNVKMMTSTNMISSCKLSAASQKVLVLFDHTPTSIQC